MKRNFYISMMMLAFSASSFAQTETPEIGRMDEPDLKPFSHLQVGISAGVTGFGAEVIAPISKNVRVRAGFNYMPKITLKKSYDMAVEGDGTMEDKDYRLNHMIECLSDLVGTPVDKYVEMDHDISFYNARLLADWYPFHKKNWHFTGGFYVGPKGIGKAFNARRESNTMVGINMYNSMHDMVSSCEEGEYPVFKFGNHYYELDPVSGEYMKEAFKVYGRCAVKMGEFPDGTPHYIYPDKDGVLEADAEVWAFKPYVGAGWSTNFGYDKRWTFSVDAGAMFWGKPHVYCNDGVDLVSDVENIGGAVGNYINILKHMPFCPNLEVRLAYTIF